VSKHTDIPLFDSAEDDIGWRYYIQSIGDELAHIEDTLRTESFAFDIEHELDDCRCPGKRCPRCSQTLCYGHFNVSRRRRDGLQVYCRACRADLRKIYKTPVESQILEPVQQHATSDCNCPGKRCNRCEQVKCYGFFHKSNVVKSGLDGRCRACISIVKKAQRDNDKAASRARERAWRERTLQSERSEIYRQKKQEKDRRYRQSHREYEREYARIRVEKRRARKEQANGTFTLEEWEALKMRYNYTCLCCGRREPEIRLTADHIVPLSKGGDNNIDNIQPLCRPCNSAKGVRTIDFRTEGKRHA
jgi:5-methylcytosine-specific restriction endonuclease McrA